MRNESQEFVVDFYQQQHEMLLRYLCRRLGSMAEATDIAQQTYERLLQTDQIDQISNPKAYVYRMATNLATDALRKRVVRGDNLDLSDQMFEDQLGDKLLPDDILDIEQTIALVQMFIAELPPKCRVAFLCYKFEDRGYEEIAQILGVSESMVRKYVIRAMAYCKDRIEQCWGEHATLPETGRHLTRIGVEQN